ncbi:hypothetical protein ASF43_08695 [Pseudorhodoferax sp. Leaf267]|nr:hypothetical protein ASF43_08695 [Pseudorhodoferax sp. Leaf267]
MAVLAAYSPARADQFDTLNFRVRHAVLYDSNFFRSSGINASNPVRSETRDMTTLGMELDKQYSLQRVELDASVVANRFRTSDYLNYNALNYRAVWHWSLTPRLHGTLRREQDEALNSYDYFGGRARNLRTDQTTAASMEAVVGRDWRLLGGLERETRTNEQPIAEQGDYTLRNVSIGVRYLFPSGSSISYRLLDGQGTYQNRIPGVTALPRSFEQLQHELRFAWAVTGKTTVGARIAHLSREHPGLALRDFSGVVGDINAQWAATGKLHFQALASRGLSANQNNTSSYISNSRLGLSANWSVRSRTVVYAGFDRTINDFDGTPPGVVPENREDKIHGMRLGLRWTPIDALSFGAAVQRSRRTSTISGADYTNNSATVDATFRF